MDEIMRAKYPRTYHLAWSPGTTSDDRFITDMSVLENASDLVVTVKMDGENTTVYPDGYYHARSMTSEHHPSRGHIGQIAATIQSDLPQGWRICGENLWAVHSIEYTDLPSLFMVFSIWDGDTCLDWDTTVEWAELLGLQMVVKMLKR